MYKIKKLFSLFTLLLLWSNTCIFAQSDSLKINVDSITPHRSGLAIKPTISVRWSTYIKRMQNGDECFDAYNRIGDILYTITLKDAMTNEEIERVQTTEFNCDFNKKLDYNKKYLLLFSIETTNDTNNLPLIPYSHTFVLKGQSFNNSFINFGLGIYHLIYQNFLIDFIGKGGPFGIVISVILLILFFLSLLNFCAFCNRLFLRIRKSSSLPRIFPKNNKMDYWAELSRLGSFKYYADQNEFVNKTLSLTNSGNVDRIITYLEDAKNESVIQDTLNRALHGFTHLKRGFSKKYSFMVYEQTHKNFESILSTELNKLLGFVAIKTTETDEKRRNTFFSRLKNILFNLKKEKKIYSIFFSLDAFWIIGTVAPMLGLFGTVLGITRAFGKISFMEAKASSEMAFNLAGDIQLALHTTIIGLIVGVLSVFFYYYFKNQIESLEQEFRRIFSKIIESLKLFD